MGLGENPAPLFSCPKSRMDLEVSGRKYPAGTTLGAKAIADPPEDVRMDSVPR